LSRVRVCFLGTPEFAVVALKQLLSDEHFEVVGVVTQPDRPSGRKMQLTPSPVKSLAQAHNIQVISPESVNKDVILQEIQTWTAEVAVVVAFGQILSTKFLTSFPFGAVNIHGSILPRWRGAAPIQRGIEAGDTEAGVTLQKVVKELDAGDIIGIRKIKISQDITAMELHDELALLGADLLHVELMDYMRGNLAPLPQDSSGVTHAKKLDKSESEIRWSEPAEKIHNKVRAFTMGPGTFTTLQGKKLKIHRTKLSNLSGPPGQILEVSENRLIIGAGEHSVELLEVQPESRNRMAIESFLKGYSLKKGDQLAAT
jgi:methionyl-tRNA formyltransferase